MLDFCTLASAARGSLSRTFAHSTIDHAIMGLQFNTTKAQSVLASRTDEAEAMKKAARVAVQAEHKLELETALAHQRSQHEAATTAAALLVVRAGRALGRLPIAVRLRPVLLLLLPRCRRLRRAEEEEEEEAQHLPARANPLGGPEVLQGGGVPLLRSLLRKLQPKPSGRPPL